ncbi:MAG: TIGR00266 family protein, partial [Methanomicrobiaceae archaeon]|nr:TIGR00266 family protein [Methanomicrobiaceae archaeon]
MEFVIEGDNLQMVILSLEEGEKVYGEAGAMVYMSGGMTMKPEMQGGLFGGIKRVVTGESFFVTEFSSGKGQASVAFAGRVPGKIVPLSLNGKNYVVQKDAFLCAEKGIEFDVAFSRRLGAGFFGGEGFILERLSGTGRAFIHACGDVTEVALSEGEELRVSTGLVVGFEEGVDYDIALAGGVRSILFSGEGIFLTLLRGPGRVF